MFHRNYLSTRDMSEIKWEQHPMLRFAGKRWCHKNAQAELLVRCAQKRHKIAQQKSPSKKVITNHRDNKNDENRLPLKRVEAEEESPW